MRAYRTNALFSKQLLGVKSDCLSEKSVCSLIPNESLVKPFGSNDFIYDRILSDYSDEVALIMIIDGKLE